ncbi:27477_t:CDS:2, partial [Racocetra persica]
SNGNSRLSFTATSYQIISNHCNYCRTEKLAHESLCPFFVSDKINQGISQQTAEEKEANQETAMNSPLVYELIGEIRGKTQKKVYQGKQAGSYYYRLDCRIENKDGIKEIFAFRETIQDEEAWQSIEQCQYVDK